MKIRYKLTSGRWLLTVGATVVFVITALNGTMPVDEVKTIVLMVMTFYFTQRRDDENGGTN